MIERFKKFKYLKHRTLIGTQLKGGMMMGSIAEKIAAALSVALSRQFDCIVEVIPEGE